MRVKLELVSRQSIIAGEGKVYDLETLWHSDEDFRPGFPISRRTLTAEERDRIVATGDPGVIQWPQLMLPPHTGEGNA